MNRLILPKLKDTSDKITVANSYVIYHKYNHTLIIDGTISKLPGDKLNKLDNYFSLLFNNLQRTYNGTTMSIRLDKYNNIDYLFIIANGHFTFISKHWYALDIILPTTLSRMINKLSNYNHNIYKEYMKFEVECLSKDLQVSFYSKIFNKKSPYDDLAIVFNLYKSHARHFTFFKTYKYEDFNKFSFDIFEIPRLLKEYDSLWLVDEREYLNNLIDVLLLDGLSVAENYLQTLKAVSLL